MSILPADASASRGDVDAARRVIQAITATAPDYDIHQAVEALCTAVAAMSHEVRTRRLVVEDELGLAAAMIRVGSGEFEWERATAELILLAGDDYYTRLVAATMTDGLGVASLQLGGLEGFEAITVPRSC